MRRDQMKTAKPKEAEARIDPETSAKILRIVSINNAFYFYKDIGQYADRYSTSLSDFSNALQTIDVRSIEFHFDGGDFVSWIRGTLEDTELANQIEKISKNTKGEELRKTLYQIVEARLTKLKKIQASEESYIERG